MYDWLRFPAAGVCTWRGRTFGRWTRHADWVCNPVWAVLDSGIGCRGRKVVLRDRRIYGKRSVECASIYLHICKSSIVQHGLIQRDRIFSVSVLLPDKPGELARVAETIANVQGNIIKLEHNQFVSTNRNAAVELRITMEAFGTDHKKKILEALDENGFRPKTISAKLY